MQRAGRVPLAPRLSWRNHKRSAKRRTHAIQYRRGKSRVAHYRELIATTRTTLGYLQDAVAPDQKAARRWPAYFFGFGVQRPLRVPRLHGEGRALAFALRSSFTMVGAV